jgi:hypothetical protein
VGGVGGRITELMDLRVPDGLFAKLGLRPRLLEGAKFPRRRRSGSAPCQEVVWMGRQIDLSRLPIITCWPEDGGPYVTLPMVVSRDPKRGIRNVGMYRVQVLGRDSVAMHWQRHKVGAAHWRDMAERGEKSAGNDDDKFFPKVDNRLDSCVSVAVAQIGRRLTIPSSDGQGTQEVGALGSDEFTNLVPGEADRLLETAKLGPRRYCGGTTARYRALVPLQLSPSRNQVGQLKDC